MTAICLLTWLAAFMATHVPADRLPDMQTGDPVLHAVGYFVLAAVWMLTLIARGRTAWWRAFLAFGVLLLYAAIDELTQPLFGRFGAWSDWLADIQGAAVGVAAAELIDRSLERIRQHRPASS